MTDFEVWFNGDSYKGQHMITYLDEDRDSVIAKAKRDGLTNLADRIYIAYTGCHKTVGCWFRKGSLWYSIRE